MPENAYELVGRLPTRVRFASRYKALHRPLNRPVEFRFERRGGDRKLSERFQQELSELGRLDHPCFLPVLDRGSMRGRQGYVVPFRDHPTVPELVKAGAFALPKALACIRSLAAGMAAAHGAGFLLGPILPKFLAWDEAAGGAYLLHHRVGAPSYLGSSKLSLPEDVQPDRPGSERADLFHWAFLAYFLLSGGSLPYAGERGGLVPLRQHCPELSPGIAAAVEAALCAAPRDRPRDGLAVLGVIQAAGFTLHPGGARAAAEEPRSEMAASARFEAAVQDLQGMRRSGAGWMPMGDEEESVPPAFAAPVDPADESADESATVDPGGEAADAVPDLALFQSGNAPAMGAGAVTGPPPRGMPPLPPALRAPGPWALWAGGVALGLVLAWILWPAAAPPLANRASAPAARLLPRGKEDGSLAADGSVQALSEARAAPYRRNPLVRQLLQVEAVTPELYAKIMQRLINLADEGALPGAFQDPARLNDIGELYRRYPEQACRELGKVLDDLRVVLGPLP